MGGKCSTVRENKAPIVTANATPASLPSAYRIPSCRWSCYNNLPENRTPAAPTAQTSYATGNCTGGGGVALPHEAANTKEIIVFHSSTKWREYFEASKQLNKLVVIYFTATWCGPCRYMEPAIKELAAKYSEVDIVKIDVDELFNVSREFGVQTMPTFLFMKEGVVIDKVVGTRIEDLLKKTEKYKA